MMFEQYDLDEDFKQRLSSHGITVEYSIARDGYQLRNDRFYALISRDDLRYGSWDSTEYRGDELITVHNNMTKSEVSGRINGIIEIFTQTRA